MNRCQCARLGKTGFEKLALRMALWLLFTCVLQASIYHCPPANAGPPPKDLTGYPSTPEGVVEAYVKAGFHVTSAKELEELTTTSDVNARLQYYAEPFSPGYDCWPVALGYRIRKIFQDASTARVKVRYDDIGYASAESFSLSKRNKPHVIYELRKERGYWRIDSPNDPPHVSAKTAIQSYECYLRLNPVSAKGKKTIYQSIGILKKYLKERSPKGNERRMTK